MNSKEFIEDMVNSDHIQFLKEPEEVWNVFNEKDEHIGDIRTSWEYWSLRYQIKNVVCKGSYYMVCESDPSKKVIFDRYGRREHNFFCNDFTDDFSTFLD